MRRIVAPIAVLAVLTSGCGDSDTELAGFVRTPPPVVGGASLPDVAANGVPFAMQAPEGGILLVYFGFTSCPDVCPTTLADVHSALSQLGDDAQRVAVALATIDPGRDTSDVLTSYARAFFADGHALRTDDHAALREVVNLFGGDYEVTETADGSVEVGHTSHLYGVDDEGTLQVTWSFGTNPDDIASDLRILLGSA